jgi:hypothetical protein
MQNHKLSGYTVQAKESKTTPAYMRTSKTKTSWYSNRVVGKDWNISMRSETSPHRFHRKSQKLIKTGRKLIQIWISKFMIFQTERNRDKSADISDIPNEVDENWMKSTNTERANGAARFGAALLPTTVGGGRCNTPCL